MLSPNPHSNRMRSALSDPHLRRIKREPRTKGPFRDRLEVGWRSRKCMRAAGHGRTGGGRGAGSVSEDRRELTFTEHVPRVGAGLPATFNSCVSALKRSCDPCIKEQESEIR